MQASHRRTYDKESEEHHISRLCSTHHIISALHINYSESILPTNDNTINKSSHPGFLTSFNRVYSRNATVTVARQRKTIPTGRAYILLR